MDPAAAFTDSRDSFQADFVAGGKRFCRNRRFKAPRASSAASPALAPIGWHITGPKAGPAAAGLPDSGKGYPVHGAGPGPDYTTDYNGARNLFAAHRLS